MTTDNSRADALTDAQIIDLIYECDIPPYCELAAIDFARRLLLAVSQPAAAPIPEDCDVRSILLDVVPGADGEGREVYARNVDDVKRLLSEMGDRLEDVDAAKRLAPSPADERAAFEAALDKRAKSAGFEVGRMTECELDNAWWGWQAGRVAYANKTGAEGALIERLKLLLSGDAAFCKTIVARSAIEQAIAILSRPSAQEDARVGLTAEARATIMDACQSISRSADALRQCHTVDGDWGDDVDAKAFYDAELRLLERLTALIARPGQPEPIDMLLFCPKCGVQHVDAPEKASEGHPVLYANAWTNSPHRSHLCHACGTIWRPADVPTNGVAAIQTRGKADTWDGEPEPRAEVTDEPSLTNPLTPYGMLVRALRIVSGTTLMDMADALLTTPAKLSAMEFDREPVTPEFAFDVAAYFDAIGVLHTASALRAATARTGGQ